MRDKIIELIQEKVHDVLEKYEVENTSGDMLSGVDADDFWSVACESTSIAEEIEKLYENNIAFTNIAPGAQAAIDAAAAHKTMINFTPSKPYDKSKFRIFETWYKN